MMDNFISHKNTYLTFNKGITIFIGQNGSGKSSVIDAITFALFGEHTRKSNKNLLRVGSSSSCVNLRFSIGSREYNAYRQIYSSGQSATAKFDLVSDANRILNKAIVYGERRQFGESVSVEVAKVVGIDYKKLKVAAVIQQGELSKIIESQPREFKELLNGLIGTDKLDHAFETMYHVISGFRQKLRDMNGGFDDLQIESIKRTIERSRTELDKSENFLYKLNNKKSQISSTLLSTEEEIQKLEPLILSERELRITEDSLIKYVVQNRDCISLNIEKLQGIINEAYISKQIADEAQPVQISLKMVKTEVEEIERKISTNKGELGRLRGLLEYAKRLEIKDGKCPICDSPVVTINKIYDINHIKNEIKRKSEEVADLTSQRMGLLKEEKTLLEKEKRIAGAEKFLSSNNITCDEDIKRIEIDLLRKKRDLSLIPTDIKELKENPLLLAVDDFSMNLAQRIAKLREKVNPLSMNKFTDLKIERTRLCADLLEINRQIGSYESIVRQANETLKTSNKLLDELSKAQKYLSILEKIRSVVFSRDGIVSLSLRSWVLRTLSMKASEYAIMFNIGISRIEMREKAREISIICYGRHGEIDMDSLSGGERVAVALALRLAIASLVGSNKLDFIILDEPTVHLDEERRKSLVKIISEVFKDGFGPLSQIIIITHDSEIFEDAEIDTVYRFKMSSEGSVVTLE
jgi:DNA repair protein SbcC/Rad50